MPILVDTSVWSLALRRKTPLDDPVLEELKRLISGDEQIYLLGIIVQELLQGLMRKSDFSRIEKHLASFPILNPKRADYIFAAEISNICRSKGVQAGTIDFLITSVAIRYGLDLFTTDKDFKIKQYSDLTLHQMP